MVDAAGDSVLSSGEGGSIDLYPDRVLGPDRAVSDGPRVAQSQNEELNAPLWAVLYVTVGPMVLLILAVNARRKRRSTL